MVRLKHEMVINKIRATKFQFHYGSIEAIDLKHNYYLMM
ncbi:hypothetical protein SAMN05444380_11570 [Thermophagus xiamenensis]|uniref:Uncharacterized protein n=1 Tax=Thermophagus xiamenensis TaxID=385682 RepID=A0A1I2CA96_9BACT|nr:hypothetical protein SAMN05444380_11570 [Thermophagus xiamenensis]